jgi:CheY-like chemotaxis protein
MGLSTMSGTGSEKILLVDDEHMVLRVYERILRRKFQVETANSGPEGLEKLATGPYAVVVADLRMPGMDGIEFLSQFRAYAPDTVRMVLTAYADVRSAIELVNRGNVFRLLTKPAEADVLVAAIEAGVEHYRLITTERETLETALRSGVNVLTEMLVVTNPRALRRVQRVGRCVRHVAARFCIADTWLFELAATLQEIGPAFLPRETLERVCAGWPLPKGQGEILGAVRAYDRMMARGLHHAEAVQGLRMDPAGHREEIIEAISTYVHDPVLQSEIPPALLDAPVPPKAASG